MAEEEKKTSNKNKNKDMNNNKDVKKKKNNKKVQKNVEKNKQNKKENNNNNKEKEPKKVKEEVKKAVETTEEVEVVTEVKEKNDEFEVKQTITTKKQNTGLKVLAAIVIDKNTIGEVTKALMNTLSPKEKLYEALENTYKEKNIEQTFEVKITEFDSSILGANFVKLLGKNEVEETIKGLVLKGTAKKVDNKTALDAKLNYNEKSIIDAEVYQELGKEGIAKFFGDEDLAVKLPKGVEVDYKKIEEYMDIVKELKKTYDSKYSDIIKYIDENIVKIEEKDGKITIKTSLEQLKSSLKGLFLKIKEKPEFIIDTYKALDKIIDKLKESGDYAHIGLTKDAIETYSENIKTILQNTTTEGIKKDVDEIIEDLKKLDEIRTDAKIELEFTLKDKKISKMTTKVDVDNKLKVETNTELKYGNTKIEELKYNEEAISDSQSTLQNITTKITMQLLSLPLAQKIMKNVQGGLGQ